MLRVMPRKLRAGLRTQLEFVRFCLVPLSPQERRVAGRLRWQLHQADFDRRAPLAYAHRVDAPDGEVVLPSALDDPDHLNDVATYFCLGKLVRRSRPDAIFEFGTFLGHGTLALAMNAPDATVYTLDVAPADRDSFRDVEFYRGLSEGYRQQPGRLLRQAPSAGRITQLYGDSMKFDFADYYGRFDFVYVDGGHSVEVVASDTREAFRLIRDRGTIVWDDYTWGSSGVPEVLNGIARSGVALMRLSGTNLVLHERRAFTG